MQVSTARTLPELLAFRVVQSPRGEAYREFNARTGQWVSTCWDAFSEHVTHRRQALVAMLLPNGLNAVSLDQAALAQGFVPVPLHAIDNPGSIAYILSDCQAWMLMVSSLAQWRGAFWGLACRCCRATA
ncbi:MAG: hypothetical protein ABI845_00865 [Polaromonas sp.]